MQYVNLQITKTNTVVVLKFETIVLIIYHLDIYMNIKK